MAATVAATRAGARRGPRRMKELFLDDYLSEAEQWEWLKGVAREYWPWVLGGIVLGALGIGGWRVWQSRADTQAQAASLQFEQLRKTFTGPNHGQAMIDLGALERDHPSSPYVDQARLLAARFYVESGALDQAVTELSRVADTTKDHELSLVARLRLARVQIAQHKPDDAIATLDKAEPGAFEGRYREVRGDAYYAKGDKPKALAEYRNARIAELAAGGGGEQSLLDLKISDLLAQMPPAEPAKMGDSKPAAPAK
jgi:predicted negative regulator of RcsB-dependent stress response